MDRHLICFLFPDSPSDSGVDLEHVSKFDTMFMYYPLKHKVPAFHKGTSTGGRIRTFQFPIYANWTAPGARAVPYRRFTVPFFSPIK